MNRSIRDFMRKPAVFVPDQIMDDAGLFGRPVKLENTPRVQKLRTDWEQTEAACEEAFKRFRQHRNAARYRAEIKAITEAAA